MSTGNSDPADHLSNLKRTLNPDILPHVLLHLDPKISLDTLLTCLLVSRVAWKAAAPKVYKHVHISDWSQFLAIPQGPPSPRLVQCRLDAYRLVESIRMDRLPTRTEMAFIKQLPDHLVELENPLDTRDTSPSGLELLFPKLEFLEVASTALLPDPRGTPTADETRPRYLRRLGSPPTVCITLPDWPGKPSMETIFARQILQQGPAEAGVRFVGYWASLLRALFDPNKRKQVYVHRMDGACLMPTVDSAHDYHLFYPRSTSAEFEDHPIVMARLAVYGTMLYQPLERGEEDDEWEYVSDSDSEDGADDEEFAEEDGAEYQLRAGDGHKEGAATATNLGDHPPKLRPSWTITGEAGTHCDGTDKAKKILYWMAEGLEKLAIQGYGQGGDEATRHSSLRYAGVGRLRLMYPDAGEICPICGEGE